MNRMPIYIKIEQYEDVLNLLQLVKKKLELAKNTLQRIHDFKAEEDAKLDEWGQHLQDVEDKLARLDMKLGKV